MLRFWFIVPFIGLSLMSFAQEAVVVIGGDAINNSFQISYTVGQIAQMYITSSDNTLAEGVQQPNSIQEIDSISEPCQVTVYPNPASDFLYVKKDVEDDLDGSIFTVLGKMVWKGKIEGSISMISIQNVPSGVYVLKFANCEGMEKNIKFIKTR